jgi:uncharacterized FlgJ-related protein
MLFSLDLPNKLVKYRHHKATVKDVVLNKDSIFNELIKQKILFPELVIKQIIVETGHFKSKVCINNKNLLGIKYIKQPLAIGERDNHAKYKSYIDCIKDYKRLQKYYLKNIDGKYAEDKNYTNLLTQIK